MMTVLVQDLNAIDQRVGRRRRRERFQRGRNGSWQSEAEREQLDQIPT